MSFVVTKIIRQYINTERRNLLYLKKSHYVQIEMMVDGTKFHCDPLQCNPDELDCLIQIVYRAILAKYYKGEN